MRTTPRLRWLIIALSIFASACTEKTYITEAPANPDAVASTDIDVATGSSSSSATTDITLTNPGTADPIPVDVTVAIDNNGSDPGNQALQDPIQAGNTTTPAIVDGTVEGPAQAGNTTTPDNIEATTEGAAVAGNPVTPAIGDEVVQVPAQGIDPTAPNMVDASNQADSPTDTETAVTPQSPDVIVPVEPAQSTPITPIPNSEPLPGNSSDTTAATAPNNNNDLLADPVTPPDSADTASSSSTILPTTTGAPGMDVDCAMSLPCQWLSADTQFSVTVTNADNIGSQGRLGIEYSVLTSHDSNLLISSTEVAIDSAGSRYSPTSLRLGVGIGGSAQGVLAGDPITASIGFDKASTAASLSSWSIGLSDSGLVRQPVFNNIPIGSATTQLADCENSLPCTWESPTGDATITLISATGFGSTNRLSTNFTVQTTRSMAVAVDDGASAVGIDGMSYRGRTHAIGIKTGAEKLTSNTIPGAQLAGTVFFFTTQTMSTALQNLSLIIYEDSPVPRWNPSFLNVPVQ